MPDASLDKTAWLQGYQAALRDVQQRAGLLQERGGSASLEGLLAELRATLDAHPDRVGSTTPQTEGIPHEDLEREWTSG
jgi:hypothetical protein